MKHLPTILVAAVLGTIATAHAAPLTGYQLYKQCISGKPAELAFCVGYVGGTTDALIQEDTICGAGNTLVLQNLMVFMKWARENPEYLSKESSLVVTASIRAAYPCTEAAPPASSVPLLHQ
jgi:hypothetical protein